jgi:transcriptional regulator with XRE-family HTH domain
MSYYRDDIFLQKLGERIRELRTGKGYSQEYLALECGVPSSQIGRMERGEVNASISYLPLIANALGVSVKKLVDF